MDYTAEQIQAAVAAVQQQILLQQQAEIIAKDILWSMGQMEKAKGRGYAPRRLPACIPQGISHSRGFADIPSDWAELYRPEWAEKLIREDIDRPWKQTPSVLRQCAGSLEHEDQQRKRLAQIAEEPVVAIRVAGRAWDAAAAQAGELVEVWDGPQGDQERLDSNWCDSIRGKLRKAGMGKKAELQKLEKEQLEGILDCWDAVVGWRLTWTR